MARFELLKELIELYSGMSPDEIVEAFQIAQADLTEVKMRARDGLASRGEIRDAQNDFAAIRGVHYTLLKKGAL